MYLIQVLKDTYHTHAIISDPINSSIRVACLSINSTDKFWNNKGWWSKGLQTFFFSGEGFVTSYFDSEKSSFLFFDGCSVVWRLTFPFSLPSFSLPFLYSSFLFTLESSFSSDSLDLWVNLKKILDGSTGNQGMIIKWAELWIKLKICTLKID